MSDTIRRSRSGCTIGTVTGPRSGLVAWPPLLLDRSRSASAIEPPRVGRKERVADVCLVAANLPKRGHEIISAHRVRTGPRLATAVRWGHASRVPVVVDLVNDDRHVAAKLIPDRFDAAWVAPGVRDRRDRLDS
jgi:hypothetical protein